MTPENRPDRDDYYMGIAMAVRRRANCVGNRVGAILVRDDRVIATGYNGTPQGVPNCTDGGCERCNSRDKYRSGEAYDLCICVHAEQNVLMSAARFGIPTDGGELYTTMQPCFGCAKELIQARIKAVYYLHEWSYPDEAHRVAYDKLIIHIPTMRQINVADPDEVWAVSGKRES